MEISFKQKKEDKPKYPYYGMRGELIVLFTEPKSGIIISSIHPPYDYEGTKRTDWCESSFTPFTGTITIK
jgi:hypothetical protein